jgi:hypothetical protein
VKTVKITIKMAHGLWKATSVAAIMLLALSSAGCNSAGTGKQEQTLGTEPINEAPASAKAPASAEATADKSADKSAGKTADKQGKPLAQYRSAGQASSMKRRPNPQRRWPRLKEAA